MKCTYCDHKLLRRVDFKERKKIYLNSNVTDVQKSMKQENVLLMEIFCRKCGKLNHFKISCRNMPGNKNKNTHSDFDVISEDESDSENIFCIDAFITKNDDLKIEVKTKKHLVQLKLDTGAQCNMISKHLYKSLGGRHLYKSRVKLISYSGHKLQPMGKTNLAVGYKSEFYTQEFQVVHADVVLILGLY